MAYSNVVMSPELPTFRLVIKNDEGDTREEPLESEQISIGRTDENTIQLDERNVSRAHAVLRRQNGTYRVEDLDSYNGIKINGKRITEPKLLEHGDRFVIGDFVVSFLSGDALADEATAQVREPVTQAPEESVKDLPPRLIVLAGPRVGSELALPAGRSIIGRGEEAAVWVNDTSISREHAAIDGNGDKFEIRDLGSSNGVLINGAPARKVKLQAGDVIELGNVRLKFVPRAVASSVPERPRVSSSASPARNPVALFVPFVLVGVLGAIGYFYWRNHELSKKQAAAQMVVNVDPRPDLAEAEKLRERIEERRRQVLVGELVEACESSMVSGAFEEAMASADEALELIADDARAASCRSDAYVALQLHQLRELNASKSWQDGQSLIAAAQRQLPSDVLESEEVRAADQGYAKMRLAEARRLRFRRRDDALAIVEDLLTHPRLEQDLRDQADKLRAQLDRPVIAAAQPPPPVRSVMKEGGVAKQVPEKVAAPSASSGNVLERCQQASDKDRCIIDEVSRPRNKAQCVALIKAHQNLHNGTRAVEVAKTCVERSLCDHPLCLALASR